MALLTASTLTRGEIVALVEVETAKQIAGFARQTEQESREARLRLDRDFTLGLYLGAGRRSNRTLTPQRYRQLATEITALTSCSDPGLFIQRAFRSLVDHETRGLGRMAGTTSNVLGKLVVPPLLNPPPGPVLEIGTLYGLFSPALIREFRRHGSFRALTVVDPFEGVQIQPGTTSGSDPTGTPVTEQVARDNFATCGLTSDEVRVIRGYSTDQQVRAVAADDRYAVIVIDGDHSAEGVLADLQWVETIARPGAVVVMDDYGDPMWSGVEMAVQQFLSAGGRLELLGTASSSAYLRMPV